MNREERERTKEGWKRPRPKLRPGQWLKSLVNTAPYRGNPVGLVKGTMYKVLHIEEHYTPGWDSYGIQRIRRDKVYLEIDKGAFLPSGVDRYWFRTRFE